MSHSRNRIILGIASLVSLILSILLFFILSPKTGSTHDAASLVGAVTFSFNIAVVFSWLIFAPGIGIAAAVLSAIAASWMCLRMGIYGYAIPAFMLQYLLSSMAARACVISGIRITGAQNIKIEKLDEDVNLLANDIGTKKAEIASLETKLERYSKLKDVAESLATALSLDDITGLIMEKALRTLDKPGRVLIFLVDPARQELMLSASRDAAGVRTKNGDIFDKWVMRNRKPLIVEDIAADFRFPAGEIEETKNVFRSLIETPLISENKVIGVLRMDSMRERMYVQDDLRLLDIVSDLGAVAIQNAFLYSRTQELATRDSLTGLVVRRYFMERFREEVKRAQISDEALSLLLLDIDHFKDYNDKYGHAAGDIVLKHLAKTISSAAGGAGIVVRYGGEEIAVLLSGKDKKKAVLEAENIRKIIRANPLTFRRRDARLTVSIGISSYPEDALVEEELIKIADERLYKAKADGRDRVSS